LRVWLFFEALQTIDPEAAAAFDATMSHVGRARRTKRPVRL